MGNYTIVLKFENPRRGRQARNFSENDSKILDLKSSSEQIIFPKLSLGAPERCFLSGEKKELFAIPSFCTMQRYSSLLLRHSLASPLNHSHFLSYHCYHKSSENAFSLVLVHSICIFSLSSARRAEQKGRKV